MNQTEFRLHHDKGNYKELLKSANQLIETSNNNKRVDKIFKLDFS